jgi:dihydrofolate reductase
MRKLKLQAQVSMDGYVGGSNGELDWMTWNWDDKLKDYATALTAPVGTILLGRKMTDGFIKHWESVAARPDDPEVVSPVRESVGHREGPGDLRRSRPTTEVRPEAGDSLRLRNRRPSIRARVRSGRVQGPMTDVLHQ